MREFAIFLFGLAAQDPREYRRLTRISRRVYRRVANLRAEIVRSAEPIAFDDLDRSAFRRFRAGSTWGRTLDCAWLHITGDVPAGAENAVVLLGIRGEGLVYSADGEVVDSISRVFQQGDLPHSGGRYRPLHHVPATDGRIDFFADVAYNGFILYPVGRGSYHGAHLAVRDDEVFALFYDRLTLVMLARETEDAALARELTAALSASWAAFTAGTTADDIAAARAALAPALAAPSDDELTYSAVGHGHLDQAWLWPIRETKRKAVRTYTRALNTIDDSPGYIYGTSQPQQLYWTKQQHPAVFQRIQRAVAAGRLEVQGSFWVETDTNMPGGESLVRQSLVGRRFLKEEFGLTDDDLRLCWLPDTFGYSGNLPQILNKSGMDWFQTIKLAWNKVTVFPHRTFTWEGIDGSSVLVHMPPEGDYNSRGAADGLLLGKRQYPEKDLGTALLVYGSGDGGGGPGEIHLEVIGREKNLRGLPKIEYSTASDFFRRLETMPIDHTHRGELYLETHQGTYTTQARIKRLNRHVEGLFHNAEALAAIVGDDCRERLEPLWRALLLGHFHDILPGSSITRVNREAHETLTELEAELELYAEELLAKLPNTGEEYVAVNLTSFAKTETINRNGNWFRAELEPYSSAPMVALTQSPPELVSTSDSISNGILTLRFDRDGTIVSCLDADGHEHSRGGLNRLTLHRDPYQFPFDAWDIDQKYTTRTPRTLRLHSSETFLDGPLIVRFNHYRFGRSRLDQRVSLEVGKNVVEFETRVDWREKHRMLRTDFYPTHYGETVKCEIQFGHIDRVTTERDDVERAQFEICAHKWVATEDAQGGFALLNTGKFGHRVKNGLVSLNLLRSPTFPDKTADRGVHHPVYAFRPFATGRLSDVIAEGYAQNNLPLVTTGVDIPSFASTDNAGIVIETIKPAENGRGIILRLYESLGEPTTAKLSVLLPSAQAVETNLMETPIGAVDVDRLEFTPFEIKTIFLER